MNRDGPDPGEPEKVKPDNGGRQADDSRKMKRLSEMRRSPGPSARGRGHCTAGMSIIRLKR